jgi:ATP-dependent Clp protease protease subunit
VISKSNAKEATVKKIDDFNASDKIDVKLLENSVHFLVGEITEDNVNECIKWLVYENLDAKPKILTLYINSTGGDLYSAFALIDIIKSSNHTVRTMAVGAVMSAAFLIFASGDKGERYVGRNASLMCHQFSDSTEGKYHDIKATMKDNELSNQRMVDVLREATGLAPSVVKKKLLPASDVYLTAEEAIELKIADQILE